jgi:hypothetical protein
LFYVINGTRAYPQEKIKGWMRDTGFGPVKSTRLLFMPAEVLLAARRP